LERSSSGTGHRHRRFSSHIYRLEGPIQAGAELAELGRVKDRRQRPALGRHPGPTVLLSISLERPARPPGFRGRRLGEVPARPGADVGVQTPAGGGKETSFGLSQEALSPKVPRSAWETRRRRTPLTRIQKCRKQEAKHEKLRKDPPTAPPSRPIPHPPLPFALSRSPSSPPLFAPPLR
jgi:hypothetical protein